MVGLCKALAVLPSLRNARTSTTERRTFAQGRPRSFYPKLFFLPTASEEVVPNLEFHIGQFNGMSRFMCARGGATIGLAAQRVGVQGFGSPAG